MSDKEEKREQGGHHHLEGDHFIIDPPKPPKSQEEINSERREINTEKFQKNQIATNNRLVLLNLFLVFFTTAGFIISIWQAKIAQRSSVAAERGAETAQQSADTSEKSVLLAQRAARESRKSSEDSARASDKSLQATINNFHQEQRAWVGFTGFSVVPDTKNTGISTDEGPSHMNLAVSALVNTGKTPARNVIGLIGLGFKDPKHVIDERDGDWLNTTIQNIQAGKISPEPAAWPFPDEYRPQSTFLTHSSISKVSLGVLPPGIPFRFQHPGNWLGGRYDVVVFGSVSYIDSQGTPRMTNFCSYRADFRDSTLTICPVFNDMQ